MLSSVDRALDESWIVEEGSHAELIARVGLYASLWAIIRTTLPERQRGTRLGGLLASTGQSFPTHPGDT